MRFRVLSLLTSALLVSGCADFNFAVWPSILGSKIDSPGAPRYLGKHESRLQLDDAGPQTGPTVRDALSILGFTEIQIDQNLVTAKRPFIIGFVCGVGGETLSVRSILHADETQSLDVVSYKTFPYPSSTRFLDEEFLDLFTQLSNRSGN